MERAIAGRDLLHTDVALLSPILERRDPGLVPVLDRMAASPLTDDERQRLRRAVVDELCELPADAGDRKALELEELLIHIGKA